MPATETLIWLALKNAISKVVTDPVMTVYDPGETFTPPSDANGLIPYLLSSDIRNDSVRITIEGDIHELSGTLLLTIMWPVSLNISHTQLIEIAGTIATFFKADTQIRYPGIVLRCVKNSDCIQPYRDGVYLASVVRIYWSTT